MEAFHFFLLCRPQIVVMVPGVPSGDHGNWG